VETPVLVNKEFVISVRMALVASALSTPSTATGQVKPAIGAGQAPTGNRALFSVLATTLPPTPTVGVLAHATMVSSEMALALAIRALCSTVSVHALSVCLVTTGRIAACVPATPVPTWLAVGMAPVVTPCWALASARVSSDPLVIGVSISAASRFLMAGK